MSEQRRDPFFDVGAWSTMLAGESDPPPDGCLGIVRRDDFSGRRGGLLVLRSGQPEYREFTGASQVAILLVADDEAFVMLQQAGLAALRPLVRQGHLHPYMLKTLAEIEDLGLADFVEDLGLVFPRH